MKKYDLSIIVVGLLFGGVVYFVSSVASGLFLAVDIMAATKLAVLSWVLLIATVVVNSWSSVDSFKQY